MSTHLELSIVEVNVNAVVEALLQDIAQWINIDELDLPDVLNIIKPPSTDHFHLLNGKASNLKAVSRGANSKILYENRIFTIETGICFNKFDFSYDFDANIKGYITNGTIIGSIHKLNICVKIRLNNLCVELESVDVTIEKKELDIKANDNWSWISSLILSWTIKSKLRSIIEKKVHKFLQKIIDKFNNRTEKYRSDFLRTNFVRDWIVDKIANL